MLRDKSPVDQDGNEWQFRVRGVIVSTSPFDTLKEHKKFSLNTEAIQLIAPFFDDFLLEPEEQGHDQVVRLEWRQKGSRFPFQPWQFSDGALRFICLATALLQPDPPSTILVDEPELGLHPFPLDTLAGLFREAAHRMQLIVPTQSAALLNHFEPGETIVVDREKGASRFCRLEAASLADWLRDFSLGELWQKNVLDGGPTRE